MSIDFRAREDNRLDKKWAHPDLAAETSGNWQVPGLMNTFFDMRDKTPEENIEDRKSQREYILETYLDSESEKKKARGEWRFVKAPGCPEEPETECDVCLRIPKQVQLAEGERYPVIVEIPGGGNYIAGSYEYYMNMLDAQMKHHKAVVMSFNYRTCVEAPYPAAINDCHAAYQYLLDHADELNIDTDRIVIHGFSTGGQFALCLGFRLKKYGIKPRGIVASLPIVDDVNLGQSGTFSFYNAETGTIDAWDGEGIRLTMQKWLGDHYGDPALPPEALPSRATVEDCVGYPPVWFPIIGEMDSSRDATLDFIRTLHAANVFVDYHVWGGINHNSTVTGTGAALSDLMAQGDDFNIDTALAHDFSRPWTEE